MNSIDVFQRLKKYNIKPSKKFGQNFLVDENISYKIVSQLDRVIDRSSDDNDKKHLIVLEVGPGMGSLTEVLLCSDVAASIEKVLAVEIDRKCLRYLGDLQELHSPKLEVIPEDALKIDEKKLMQLHGIDRKFTIISNLPYNISTVLLTKWLRISYLLHGMVLMFQKEVASRIVASPHNKSYGVLSILSQYLCKTRIAFHISPESFFPSPSVDSSIVLLTPREDVLERLELYDQLKFVCNSLFNQRRKTINNTLKKISNSHEQLLDKLKLDPKLRPENLSVSDFVNITKEMGLDTHIS